MSDVHCIVHNDQVKNESAYFQTDAFGDVCMGIFWTFNKLFYNFLNIIDMSFLKEISYKKIFF